MATALMRKEVGVFFLLTNSLTEEAHLHLDFRYLTPKLRLDQYSLTKPLLLSSTFHIICSPSRCCELVQGIVTRRAKAIKEIGSDVSKFSPRPIIVWEPVPDRCCEEELQNLYQATQHVDVVSPNENEFARFCGKDTWMKEDPQDRAFAEDIVGRGIGPEGKGTLVIRAGKEGCYAFSKYGMLELPAFQGVHVVDPTGAGNTFLGALAQGLASVNRFPFNVVQDMLSTSKAWMDIKTAWGGEGKVPVALVCAIVAASFAIEQIGVPTLSFSGEGIEYWNRACYTERIRLYSKQLMDMYDTFSDNSNPTN